MDYLDDVYLTRLLDDLIGKEDMVLGFARAYGKPPKPRTIIIAFTENEAVIAYYDWKFERKKVKRVPSGKFENKAKWIHRWSGERMVPVGIPVLDNMADLAGFLDIKGQVEDVTKPDENVVTVGRVRDHTATAWHHYIVAFTDQRVLVLKDDESGTASLSVEKPLSESAGTRLLRGNTEGPLDVPLMAPEGSTLCLQFDGEEERQYMITDLHGMGSTDYVRGDAGIGSEIGHAIGKGIRYVKSSRVATGPELAAIAGSVESPLEKLVEMGWENWSASTEDAVRLRWEIARLLPEMIETVDGQGVPVLKPGGEIRGEVAGLRAHATE